MNLTIRQKKAVQANDTHILCLSPAGGGKALPNSTRLPTTKGWKTVGEIRPGDFLFDRLGQPTKVLQIFPQGEKEVFELTFGDKRTAKCSEDHIWLVHKDTWHKKNDFRECTTREILDYGVQGIDSRGHKFSHWHIPCAKAIQYSEKQFIIDPYVIGSFLGDGSCKEEDLVISSNDEEIVEEIAKLIRAVRYFKWADNNYSWKFECVPYKNAYNQSVKYFKTKDFFKGYEQDLLQYSYDKRIPEEYKYGSIEQRLALLQGLFDTDGNIDINGGRFNVRFTSTSYQLILDVKEVLGSLGYISTIKTDKRIEKYTKGICYELLVNMPNSDKYKLFRLKRKRDIGLKCVNKKQTRNYDRTTITDIKDLGYKEEMTCFLVDNDEHLFLMNDFIVTHNTRVLTERIKDLILNKFVDPKQITVLVFTNLAAEEVKKRLGSIVNGVFIGTIHSYANQLCMANGISTSQAIEDRDFDVILKKALTIPKSKYPHIQHLLIDEAQDLGSLDFAFVERCHADNIFFVGDDRQAIYGFRGCSDKYIRYMKNDPDYTKFYLTEDFRNAPNILEFANDFLGSYRALGLEATAYKTEDGIVDECDIDEALSNLVSDGNWSSWFILTRTNNEILEIQEMLDEMQIPNVTFKRGDFDDLAQMDELIASNRVKVMTIHTSKGLEAKNVIVTGAKIFNEEERKIAYVAATRAENALYWCPSFSRFQKKGYKAHNGMKQNKIFDKAELEMVEF